MEEVRDEEFVSDDEMAEAADPSVGTGTPETAPHETPFDDDDELDADGAEGAADDDDELDEDDDDTPLEDV